MLAHHLFGCVDPEPGHSLSQAVSPDCRPAAGEWGRGAVTGSVPFSWVSNGRRLIFFLQRVHNMLPMGYPFRSALGSSYKPLQKLLLSAPSFFNFTFLCYITCVWVCEGRSPAWFNFLEIATVGGRFFLSKGGLTCCQRGTQFDQQWSPAINISKLKMKTYENSAKSEKKKKKNQQK